jgi:hypothetical protein
VKGDPNFARARHKRNNRPSAAGNQCFPPRIKRANGLVESLASLNKRLPLWRVRETRDDLGEKPEHPHSLHEIKTSNADDTDERPDQSWANEIFLSRYFNEQYYAEHCKSGLRENTKCNVNQHASRCDWQ